MKRSFVVWLLLLTAAAYSQPKLRSPNFYVFNAKWEPTNVKEAVYMITEIKEADTSWKYDSYNFYGPLIKTERYKTKEREELHGESIYYNKKGRIDSIHYYSDGLPDRSWYYLNDTGKIYLKKEYDRGRLVKITDYLNEDTLERNKLLSDITKDDEKESDFNGGQSGWRRFLGKNFRYPERAIKSSIEGMVILQFMVDKEGYIKDPVIYKSVEYSLDAEALRIISISPQWIPAEQGGKNVKSYKRQPITYRLE